MFSSNKKTGGNPPTLAETIIGKGTVITGGKLTGTSSVRIDGGFVGTIDIDGDLILGESGSIEGDIRAKSAVIAGNAHSGRILCAEALHIVSTGAVYGDMQVGSLIVDEDAVFIGNCKMVRDGLDERTDADGQYRDYGLAYYEDRAENNLDIKGRKE